MIAGGSPLTVLVVVSGAVDVVGTDSSWRRRSTGSLKVSAEAGAFGLTSKPHPTSLHMLVLEILQSSVAMSDTGWEELLYPLDDFSSGCAELLDVRGGHAYAPTAPGFEAVHDLDTIDNAPAELL